MFNVFVGKRSVDFSPLDGVVLSFTNANHHDMCEWSGLDPGVVAVVVVVVAARITRG